MANYFDIRNSTFGLRIVLANPPFNDSDWFRKDDDVRWQYGVPPRGNANLAWVQHFIHHLAPHGMAGFVLVRCWFLVNSRGEGCWFAVYGNSRYSLN